MLFEVFRTPYYSRTKMNPARTKTADVPSIRLELLRVAAPCRPWNPVAVSLTPAAARHTGRVPKPSYSEGTCSDKCHTRLGAV